jgi:hypothetical protein
MARRSAWLKWIREIAGNKLWGRVGGGQASDLYLDAAVCTSAAVILSPARMQFLENGATENCKCR